MPISAANRRRLNKARRNLQKARERVTTNEARITRLQVSLRERRAAGDNPTRIATLSARVEALRINRGPLRAAALEASNTLLNLREDLVLPDPADSFSNLKAKTPIAMLPVRLEYRYFTRNPTELKIRIYPQELQIDDHQQSLSSDEIDAGHGFWLSVFEARSSGGDEQSFWQSLARQHGAGRARWITDQLMPLNMGAATLGEAPDFPTVTAVDDWALDAMVCCLPERWVVLGYRAGKPVVRAWGLPVDESLAVNLVDGADDDELDRNQPPVDDDTEVPSAPGLDWLVDYDTALAAGMAITLTEQDDAQLALGYDELLVVGVDWSRSEEESADAFEALMHNHRYEQGLEIPNHGEPTNWDEEQTDAAERVAAFEQRQTDYLNPLTPVADSETERDGALLNDGLGLSHESPLLHVPGSEHGIHLAQADMHTALYEGTLGYFADQMLDPMVSDADVARLKKHFIRHIRPLGALPLLRVGDQPYGVLPVCDSKRFTAANNNIGNKIQQETNTWRGYWQSAARRSVPRIGATDDLDDDLLNTLRMSARATDFRIREVVGPTLVANFANIQTEHVFQEAAAKVWMQLGNYQKKPFVADAALSRHHNRVRLPFVQRGEKTQPLTDDYLSRIAEQVRKAGGFKEMLQKKLADPDSVLEAITTYSALLELGKSAARLSVASDPARFRLSRLVARNRELNDISNATAPADGIALVNNALAQQPAVASNHTVVDEVARLLRDGSATANIDRAVLRSTREFESALQRLAARTTGELEVLLTGALDSLSHRLDCWMSSLANQRLDELRDRNARGLYLGGYGWLDDVRPAPRATGFGMALAPSLNHAKTIAVLKSAHAAHAGDDKKLLAVDLSSARVRKALTLIEGLRQGQTAGALLGYRLERDLQRRRLSLVQFVGTLRRIAPLGQVNQTAPGAPLESIETREVVDGVRLLELWRESEDFFADHPELPQSGRDKADLQRALQALDDTLDALNDLMLAESVYQYVNGNNERATAALDSLERQAQFPEPEIAATPRGASVYHYRLVVTLDDSDLAPEWDDLPGIADDPRARVDRRVNSWLGSLFGNPQKYQFTGTLFVDLEETEAGVKKVTRHAQEVVNARLSELNLHPASIVAAATTPSADKPSELEARVERLLRSKAQGAQLPDNVIGTQMVIHTHAQDPEAVGFGGFNLLVQHMADLLGSAEAGDATSLAPEDAEDPGLDAPEFAQRVEVVRADFIAAANALNPGGNAQTTRSKLQALADHGVQNALPTTDDERLISQAEQVAAQVQVTQRRLTEHAQGFERSQASALEQVDHDAQTLKILYGENFVALPLCLVSHRQQQQASLDNAAHLLPGGSAEVQNWLQVNALARSSVARLTHLLNASELANVDETTPNDKTHVIQLPYDPDERWVGLPLQANLVRPQANLSIVVQHGGDSLNLAARQALLVIDAWEDRIPDASQDAAVAFQYDAPNARAPQTVLLAVPPERNQQTWQFDDVVGAVREAKDLSAIRMVDLAHVDLLPRILPALYFPFDLDEDSIALNFGHAIEAGNLMNALNR